MKIAFKYIYYKAAASQIFTVELSYDDWQKFLWADPKDRKKVLLCDILKQRDKYLLVRELTWIPLDNNKVIASPRFQLTRKQDNPTYMLGDYTRAFLEEHKVELVEALLEECRIGNISRMQLSIVLDTLERVIIAPGENVRIPYALITHFHFHRMKRMIWSSFRSLLWRSKNPVIQRWLWIRHTDFVEATQRDMYVDENLNPFWYIAPKGIDNGPFDMMPGLSLNDMGFAIVDGKVVNDERDELRYYSYEYKFESEEQTEE